MFVSNEDYWVLQALSYVGESLSLLVAAVGLVWSLIWWRDAGLSARLSAAGFGLHLVVRLSTFALTFLASSWTFYTPYSIERDYPLTSLIALSAFATLGAIASDCLLVAALIAAWRRHLFYVRRES